MSGFSQNNIKDFFDTILKGESVTYNDHNWYTNTGLKGYIQGRSSNRYPLLKKDLSLYTIGEIMDFQSKPRNSTGQLWATGRYQIIPVTLKGLVTNLNTPKSKKYDKKLQDEYGITLLLERSNARKYLKQEVSDTKENLQKASIDVAKIWSSVGVPYDMQGFKQWVKKNQSYYTGGGDTASIKTEVVQEALKKLRKSFGTGNESNNGKGNKKSKFILISSIALTLIGIGMFAYYKFYRKK